MQTIFLNVEQSSTDPYQKLVEDSGLAKIFGTDILT